VAATSPPYPTPGWATTQVYPAQGDKVHGAQWDLGKQTWYGPPAPI
jgi:hypothetical protein